MDPSVTQRMQSSIKYPWRHICVWLATTLLLMLLAVYPLQRHIVSVIATPLTNALHFPAGFILFYLLKPITPYRRSSAWLYNSLIFIGCLLVIALVEIVQPYVHRDASLHDAWIGALGSSAAVLWYISTQQKPLYRWLAFLTTASVFCYVNVPLYQAARARVWQYQHFPIFADFEQPILAPMYETHSLNQLSYLPHQSPQLANQHYLRLTPAPVPWPGIHLLLPDISWQGFQQLCFNVRLHGTAGKVILRLDDSNAPTYQSRYSHWFDNTTDWQTHCIALQQLKTPNGRQLDLQQMQRLILFLPSNSPIEAVDFDQIELR